VIGLGTGAHILIATRPVDFRKGADSLAALVKAAFGADLFSGVVYVFRAKKMDGVKLIWWAGTGLCLMAKRLEEGSFRWPAIHDGVMRLTSAQLGALLEVWTGAASMPDDARKRRNWPVERRCDWD
jgi:transposase